MLQQLLSEVEHHLGRKVLTKGDCLHLSDCLLEVTGDFISYNTIRRMYGLAPAVAPRVGTLDVLSRFVGYRDYARFTASSRINARWQELEQALLFQSQGDLTALLAHVSGIESNSIAVDVSIMLARDWFRMGDHASLTQLFALNRLQTHCLEYSEQLHLAHSLGLLFRTVEFSDPALLESVHFQDNVYTMFVDYSALNGYYGEWNDWYLRHEEGTREDFILFNRALRILRNRLEGLPLGQFGQAEIHWVGMHPILRSRIFSVIWMTEARLNPCDVWALVHGGQAPAGRVSLSSLHEIMFISVLEADRQLMDWIIDGVQVEMKNLVHHEFHDLQMYRMVSAARYLLMGDPDRCGLELDRVDLGLINLSMREVLSLLFWGLRIRSGSGDATNHWLHYRSLASDLGHSIFDDDFVSAYGEGACGDAGMVSNFDEI